MKLCSLVLAGGAGQRFGGRKLLATMAGRALLDYALDSAAAATDTVVVVVGHEPSVADLAREWSHANGKPVRTVTAANPDEGMGASLRTGLAALDPTVDGAFVFLGDMPCIPAGIFAPLAKELAKGATAAAPTFREQRGHPVLLGRTLIAQHHRIGGDRGAADLLSREAGLVLVEACDDGVLFDIDTPQDLAEGALRTAPAHDRP